MRRDIRLPRRPRGALAFSLVAILFLAATGVCQSSGLLDRTFGVRGRVIDIPLIFYHIAIQPDGKIVAVGWGTTPDGFQLPFATRYNANGSLDTTFGDGGRAFITVPPTSDPFSKGFGAMDVAIQPNGKIVIAVRDFNFSVGGSVCRLNSDGSMDTSFGKNGFIDGFLPSVAAALPDGRLLLAMGGWLYRMNVDGSFDPNFDICNPGGGSLYPFNRIDSVIQPDGKIVTEASNSGVGIGAGFVVFRCNEDGTPDTSFGSGGKVVTPIGTQQGSQSIALQPDGKIIVAGQVWISQWRLILMRYNPNGSLDTAFGTGGIVTSVSVLGPESSIVSVALQSNGKILVNATTNPPGDHRDTAVIRFDVDGSLDTTFGGGDGIATIRFHTNDGYYDYSYAMALDSQDRAVVVGAIYGGVGFQSVIGRLLSRPRYGAGLNPSSERRQDDVIPTNPIWSGNINNSPFPLERLL